MITAKSIMKHNFKCLRENQDIDDVKKTLINHKDRYLPIIDKQKKLCGIVSPTDIKNYDSELNPIKENQSVKINKIMTKDVISCSRNSPLGQVLVTMMTHNIRCVPVVEENKPIGLITTADILNLYRTTDHSNTEREVTDIGLSS